MGKSKVTGIRWKRSGVILAPLHNQISMQGGQSTGALESSDNIKLMSLWHTLYLFLLVRHGTL